MKKLFLSLALVAPLAQACEADCDAKAAAPKASFVSRAYQGTKDLGTEHAGHAKKALRGGYDRQDFLAQMIALGVTSSHDLSLEKRALVHAGSSAAVAFAKNESYTAVVTKGLVDGATEYAANHDLTVTYTDKVLNFVPVLKDSAQAKNALRSFAANFVVASATNWALSEKTK